MPNEEFEYIYNNKVYKIVITYKGPRQKNIYYRKKGDVFCVSAGTIRSRKQIIDGLPQAITKLNSIASKRNTKFYNDTGVYVFGEFREFVNDRVKVGNSSILFLNKEQFYDRTKGILEAFLKDRVEYYSILMGVKTKYKVKVKDVKTIYGSNSKATASLTFNSVLIHYSSDIIDSVVVHELAHDFVRDHSKRFYDVILKTMPDYYVRDKKLKGGIVK